MKNENLIIVIIIAIILIFIFGNFSPFYKGMMAPYGMMFGYYSSWAGFFMMAIWILVIIALVLFILWLIQQLQNKSGRKR